MTFVDEEEAEALIAWVLELAGEERRSVVQMALPFDRVHELPKVQINADVAERCIEASREYFTRSIGGDDD